MIQTLDEMKRAAVFILHKLVARRTQQPGVPASVAHDDYVEAIDRLIEFKRTTITPEELITQLIQGEYIREIPDGNATRVYVVGRIGSRLVRRKRKWQARIQKLIREIATRTGHDFFEGIGDEPRRRQSKVDLIERARLIYDRVGGKPFPYDLPREKGGLGNKRSTENYLYRMETSYPGIMQRQYGLGTVRWLCNPHDVIINEDGTITLPSAQPERQVPPAPAVAPEPEEEAADLGFTHLSPDLLRAAIDLFDFDTTIKDWEQKIERAAARAKQMCDEEQRLRRELATLLQLQEKVARKRALKEEELQVQREIEDILAAAVPAQEES